MYGILLFGLMMIAISLFMMARPDVWGEAIVRFARLPYMHPLEISLRLGFGAVFVLCAEQSKFPLTIQCIGYVLLAAGVGLVLTPPSCHRRFAVWSAEKFSRYFRPASFVSLTFGAFLVYAVV